MSDNYHNSKRVKVLPGSVLRLNEITHPGKPAHLPETQGTSDDFIGKITSLHDHMVHTQYTNSWKGESYCYKEWESEFGEEGGELRGNRFTVQVPRQEKWQNNHHFIHIKEENPEEKLKLLKGSNFEITPHLAVPILDVEITAKKPDVAATGVNLVLPVNATNEIYTEFVILQQDKTGPSMQWNDITSQCKKELSELDHSIVISIPLEKSSKIWIIRVKRSLRGLIRVMLTLLFGRILVRILVFSKLQGDKEVLIRVVGMGEGQYQNPEVHIAKAHGFELVEESDAKQLLRKGKLHLSFYLSGKCQKSTDFDLSEIASLNVGKRAEFTYILRESGCVPKIEIKSDDKDEGVLWSFGLSDAIQKQIEASNGSRSNVSGKAENKVFDHVVLEVSSKVAASWRKFGCCLGVSCDDMDIIDQNNPHDVVEKCMTMLKKWRRESAGSIAELVNALRDPSMKRFDVVEELLIKFPVQVL